MKSIGYMVKNRTFVTNVCANRLAVQKVTNVWSVKSRHSRTPEEACDDNRLFCVISKTNQHASECPGMPAIRNVINVCEAYSLVGNLCAPSCDRFVWFD